MSLLISRLGNKGASVPGGANPLVLEFQDSSPAKVYVGEKTVQPVVINWGDGTASTVVTTPGSYSHLYATSDGSSYQVSISGGLIALGADAQAVTDSEALLMELENPGLYRVVDFGTIPTFTTPRFVRSQNLTYVSGVLSPYFTSLNGMFYECSSINDPTISGWDVSNITDMSHMFRTAYNFTQNIANWDVSGVTNMDWMFHAASWFGGDLSGWCVPLIPSQPMAFDWSAGGITNPVWGTCPAPCFQYYDFVQLQFESTDVANGSTTIVDTSSFALTPSAMADISAQSGWWAATAPGAHLHYNKPGSSFDPGVGSVYTMELIFKVAPNSSGYMLGFDPTVYHSYGADASSLTFTPVNFGGMTLVTPMSLFPDVEYHYALCKYNDETGRIFLNDVLWMELAAVPNKSAVSGLGIFGVYTRPDLSAPGLSVKAFRFTHEAIYYTDALAPSLPLPAQNCDGPPLPPCFAHYNAVALQLDMVSPDGTIFVDTSPSALTPSSQNDVEISGGFAISSVNYFWPSLMYAPSTLFNNTGEFTLEFYLTITEVADQARYFCGESGSHGFYIEADSPILHINGWFGNAATVDFPEFVLNQEYHVGIQSDGTNGFAFLDGNVWAYRNSLAFLTAGPMSFDVFAVSGLRGLYGAKIRGLRFTRAAVYEPVFMPYTLPPVPLPTTQCSPPV